MVRQYPWLLTRESPLFFQVTMRRSSGSRSRGGHEPGPLPSVPIRRKRPSSSLLALGCRVAGSWFREAYTFIYFSLNWSRTFERGNSSGLLRFTITDDYNWRQIAITLI